MKNISDRRVKHYPGRLVIIIGICAVICLFIGGIVALYFRLRGPIGGESPYKIVNQLEKQSSITFTAAQSVYAPDTDVIRLTIRNDAYEWLIPEQPRRDEWVLEKNVGRVWHTVRALDRDICWDFPPEDYEDGVRPAGIVEGDGGERVYLCDVWLYYAQPLDPGSYRIVFPRMRLTDTQDLAVEFDVR